MLETQALQNVSYLIWLRQELDFAYNKPTAKMAPADIFIFSGICRVQITKRGRMRIEKSETIFAADVARMEPFVEMQVPGSSGFEIFARGTQAKMKDMEMEK